MQCQNCPDEELISRAVNSVVSTGTVTNAEANPLEVWITPDGSLRITIPNELYDDNDEDNLVTAQTNDDVVKECKNCREPTVFHKDNHDNLHCSNCGLSDPKDVVPPFPRTLDFPKQKNAQIMDKNIQNVPKITEIEPLTIPGQNQPKSIIKKKIKTPEEQQDINETADNLGL